jgi:hypothetical protein
MTNPVIEANGLQYWIVNGQLHRIDGPAIIEPNGTQKWYVRGERHRTDGPASIYPDGSQYWFVNGKWYRTAKSFQEAANLTNEDITALVLTHGAIS